MNIIIMGPQASGKGTQARLIAAKLDLAYFEAGDVLREKANENSVLGKKIYKVIYQKGELVSDQVMKRLVEAWLSQANLGNGLIFDGFPRNRRQYRLLEKILANRKLKIDRVIFLKVSKKTAIRRLTARRVCPRCDRNYNLLTKPPRNDEECDYCRAKLVQRRDDLPEVIRTRLKTYEQATKPLIAAFRHQGILEEVNGERPIRVIFKDILNRLGGFGSKTK
jgi:adenylate kinase